MKSVSVSSLGRLFNFFFLLLASAFFAVPTARAGLTVDVHLYRDSYGYYFYPNLSTNAVAPDFPEGVYRIASWQYPTNGSVNYYHATNNSLLFGDGNGNYGSGHYYLNFDSLMNGLTNGLWSILVTNATSSNLYQFSVSASGLTSNSIGAPVTIVFPMDGAQYVTNQPLFAWAGPTNWTGTLNVEDDFVDTDGYYYYEDDADLAPDATNWMPSVTLPDGTNYFYVNYNDDLSSQISAGTPTNTVSGEPIAGWLSSAGLSLYGNATFTVGQPINSGGGSGGHTIAAYYSYEDNNLFSSMDYSGNGNDMNGYAWFDSPPYITNDALEGFYAVAFGGGNWQSPPTNLTQVLEGSFTVSLWLKTSESLGNDYDDAYYGAGIFSANSDMTIPMALTGNKLAFQTEGDFSDTLHSITNINTGNYRHLVVTRDQNTGEKKIYIDGALDASDYGASGPLSTLYDPELFLGLSSAYSDGIIGNIDEVQIYSGVLSPSEVMFLHDNPGSTVPDSTGEDFNAALNTTNQIWTTSGDASWFVESSVSQDGLAAQSGDISDNQTNRIETTVLADGQLSFYWKVSSEDGFDYLTFYINGIEQDSISGEVDWNQETYSVSANDTLRWEYGKDGSVSDGSNAGWLDQVVLPSDTTTTTPVSVIFQLIFVRDQDFLFGQGDLYSVEPQIDSISPAPATTNRIESPGGQTYTEVWTGDSSTDIGSFSSYTNLDQLISACTNGDWKLYINRGAPDERLFLFHVSIPGLTTNVFGPVTVLVPAINSTDVPTNTPIQWSIPSGFDAVSVDAFQYPSFDSIGYNNSLSVNATNWPSPPAFPYGTNAVVVSCWSYYYPGVAFTTPVDAGLNPISSWSTSAHLESFTGMKFVVGAPEPLPVQIISPQPAGNGSFQFAFQTLAGRPHTIEVRTNLTSGVWMPLTNFTGDGTVKQFTFPTTNPPTEFFRVTTQ